MSSKPDGTEKGPQELTSGAFSLLQMAGSERLRLVKASPWKGALGAFMADDAGAGYWSTPEDYGRGDLLLTVLSTRPRMLLCLEWVKSTQRKTVIDVEDTRVEFEPEVEKPVGTRCSVPTGNQNQAAALLAAKGKCWACERNFGSLLGGQGIAGLEVHQLNADDASGVAVDTSGDRLVVLCAGCHLMAHCAGSPSAEAVRLAWRPSCPNCGAHPPNEMLWGFPIEPVTDPFVTVGGCDVVDFSRWHCTSCGHCWGSSA